MAEKGTSFDFNSLFPNMSDVLPVIFISVTFLCFTWAFTGDSIKPEAKQITVCIIYPIIIFGFFAALYYSNLNYDESNTNSK